MAKRAKYDAQTQARAALAAYSRTELAEKLGVSTRTLRRWANQGTQPADSSKRAALDKFAGVARSAVARVLKRQGSVVPRVAVPILPERKRVVLRDVTGKPKGRRVHLTRSQMKARGYRLKDGRKLKSGKYSVFEAQTRASDWANYDVRGRTLGDMLAILRAAAVEGRNVQLLIQGPKTPEYPNGIHYSPPMDVDADMEDDELLERLDVGFGESVLEIGVRD